MERVDASTDHLDLAALLLDFLPDLTEHALHFFLSPFHLVHPLVQIGKISLPPLRFDMEGTDFLLEDKDLSVQKESLFIQTGNDLCLRKVLVAEQAVVSLLGLNNFLQTGDGACLHLARFLETSDVKTMLTDHCLIVLGDSVVNVTNAGLDFTRIGWHHTSSISQQAFQIATT